MVYMKSNEDISSDITHEIDELYYYVKEYDNMPECFKSNVSERIYNTIVNKKEFFEWFYGVDYL